MIWDPRESNIRISHDSIARFGIIMHRLDLADAYIRKMGSIHDLIRSKCDELNIRDNMEAKQRVLELYEAK